MRKESHPILKLLDCGLLVMAFWLVSGCAAFRGSQDKATNEEAWKDVHDSLYDSFWVDAYGDPRSR